MREIDQARRQVDWDRERAHKLKRLTVLFSLIDILIIIKIIYNWIVGPYWDSIFTPIFWLIILIAAAIISIYLSAKLWLYERKKKKQLDLIAQRKRDIMAKERENGLF